MSELVKKFSLWLRRYCRHLPLIGLLAAFWTLGISASLNDSVTSDELFHITAGYSYWKTGSHRLQPENGLLPQLIAGLPLALTERSFDFQQPQVFWHISDVNNIGRRLFFDSGLNPRTILLQARMIMGVVGVLLGLTIYLWSLRLFGLIGAYISVTAFAFSPLLLSHGVYATSDAVAALMFLWTTAAIQRLFKSPGVTGVLLVGFALTGLMLSKYSFPIIVPVTILLAAIQRPPWRVVPHLALAMLIAWVGIWTAYRWEFAAVSPGEILFPGWIMVNDPPSLANSVIDTLRRWRLMPEAWLFGFAHVLRGSVRLSYLMGELSYGHWYYFPVAILVKTPLAILAAAAWTLFHLNRRMIPLAVLLVLYLAVSMFNGPYIGIRHLLPVYAAAFILMGSLSAAWTSPAKRIILAILAAALILESTLAWPGYLAHFNPLIPKGKRFRILADSNLDWGQDLYRLARWAKAQGQGVIYMSLFGNMRLGSSSLIEVRQLPGIPAIERNPDNPLEPGLYCISSNNLHLNVWTFQKDRPDVAKLFAHLRRRDPDEWVGDSIAVYRVSQADLAAIGPR